MSRDLDGKFELRDDQIVKKSNGEPIPDDEPVFILRARDRLALRLLCEYRAMSERDGCNDYHFGILDKTIARFADFRVQHPERMKQPSVTRGQ